MIKGFVRHIDDFKDKNEGYLIHGPEGEVVESKVVTLKKEDTTLLSCHHNKEEYCFVHKGEGEVVLDGEKHIVRHGDFLYIPCGCAHFSKGISEDEFVYLCVSVYLDRTPSL